MRRLVPGAVLVVLLGWPGLFAPASGAGAGGARCLPAADPSCPQAFPGLPNFAEVSQGRLYRSAQPTAEGLRLAKERFGIRTVVNLRTLHSDRKAAEGLGLQYHRIPFAAWHVTPEDAVRFLAIVSDGANHPVLVHCHRGADRTGIMVAIYRVFAQGWTAEEALEELPRFGFHPIYANLKAFLRDAEWRRAAEQAGLAGELAR